MKPEMAECYRAGQWFEVRVMCRAEEWAMVRRKWAMPFVVREKDLRPVNKKEACDD